MLTLSSSLVCLLLISFTSGKSVKQEKENLKIKQLIGTLDNASDQTNDKNKPNKPPILDIGFLIENPGNKGEDESIDPFTNSREFVQSFVKSIKVTNNGNHVGVVTYGEQPYMSFDFNEYFDNVQVSEAMNGINKPFKGSNVGKALAFAKKQLFDGSARPETHKALIVLSTKAPADKVSKAADDLKKSGIIVYTIGVDAKDAMVAMNDIASDPIGTHKFLAKSYELQDMVKQIRTLVYDDAKRTPAGTLSSGNTEVGETQPGNTSSTSELEAHTKNVEELQPDNASPTSAPTSTPTAPNENVEEPQPDNASPTSAPSASNENVEEPQPDNASPTSAPAASTENVEEPQPDNASPTSTPTFTPTVSQPSTQMPSSSVPEDTNNEMEETQPDNPSATTEPADSGRIVDLENAQENKPSEESVMNPTAAPESADKLTKKVHGPTMAPDALPGQERKKSVKLAMPAKTVKTKVVISSPVMAPKDLPKKDKKTKQELPATTEGETPSPQHEPESSAKEQVSGRIVDLGKSVPVIPSTEGPTNGPISQKSDPTATTESVSTIKNKHIQTNIEPTMAPEALPAKKKKLQVKLATPTEAISSPPAPTQQASPTIVKVVRGSASTPSPTKPVVTLAVTLKMPSLLSAMKLIPTMPAKDLPKAGSINEVQSLPPASPLLVETSSRVLLPSASNISKTHSLSNVRNITVVQKAVAYERPAKRVHTHSEEGHSSQEKTSDRKTLSEVDEATFDKEVLDEAAKEKLLPNNFLKVAGEQNSATKDNEHSFDDPEPAMAATPAPAPYSRTEPASYVIGKECKARVDIAFVLDGSKALDELHFNKSVGFVKNIIRSFRVSREDVHVAIAVCSQRPHIIFDLKAFYDHAGIEKAMQSIAFPNGHMFAGGCLKTIKTGIYENSGRHGVPKLLYYMSGGTSRDHVAFPSRALRDLGVQVYSLGLGAHYDGRQLKEVSTAPYNDHVLATRYEILGLLQPYVTAQLCRGSGGKIVTRTAVTGKAVAKVTSSSSEANPFFRIQNVIPQTKSEVPVQAVHSVKVKAPETSSFRRVQEKEVEKKASLKADIKRKLHLLLSKLGRKYHSENAIYRSIIYNVNGHRDDGCKDYHGFCEQWGKQGLCNKSSKQGIDSTSVQRVCPKTCTVCYS